VVALNGVLLGGRVATTDAAAADVDAAALREVARQCRDDDGLVSALLPLEGGLLVALRHRQ
jgi:predicted O-methyltransferase YrrM